MKKDQNLPCLEIFLDEENQTYENVAREAIYRETSKQFPKKCTNCGKIYRTEEQFTREAEVCGPAHNYKEISMLCFLRNCSCRSTIGLSLEHVQFDAFESYSLFFSMQVLGEECFKRTKDSLTQPSSTETECGKCFAKYLTKKEIEEIKKRGQETREEQIHMGLNIFRERYNAWIEKRANS